jgi:uncharacterized MAPEG superfamily protein
MVDTLALLFMAARVAYVVFYLLDQDKWRTMAWSVAFLTAIALYAFAMLNLQVA